MPPPGVSPETFFAAIAGPLAELLRAAADWLDEPEQFEDPEPSESPKPLWVQNDRGGFDPAA